MKEVNHFEIWDSFLETWPIEQIQNMSLSKYTNLNRSDAFVYWLESVTKELGSVLGGSALKWGIYQRSPSSPKPKSAGIHSDDKYSWYKKYGSSSEEAFQTIREGMLELINAVQDGDLERIDSLDVCWPIVKWKIAFLYQGRNAAKIFPVYNSNWLFHSYRQVVSGVKRKDATRPVMYPTLLDRYKTVGDVFDIARKIWTECEQEKDARYWAVPVHFSMSDSEILEFCDLPEVNPEDIHPLVKELLSNSDIKTGDRLAILDGDIVHSVATVESAEPEAFAWTQKRVEITPEIAVSPAKVVELDASERESIWGALSDESSSSQVRYWKIAPGENAVLWEEWKAKKYIAIGWPDFGDLSNFDRAGFETRMQELQGQPSYGPAGPRQAWRFHRITVGSRIIANQGTHTILGIGTVTGPYEYHPEAGEYCHRLPVKWDDLTKRAIDRKGWRKSLIELDEAEFGRLSASASGEVGPDPIPEKAVKPVAGPCPEPQSIILYGPPGTGKTWTTLTRALELIFPINEVDSWSLNSKSTHFRQLQRAGRIEFVTFHQAYGYEEFVEGIRPVMGVDSSEEVRYELHQGVFKRIALKAAAEGLRRTESVNALTDVARFNRLWSEVIRQIEEGDVSTATSSNNNVYELSTSRRESILFTRSSDSPDSVDDTEDVGWKLTASKVIAQLLWENRNELGPVDSWSAQMVSELVSRERNTNGGVQYTAHWMAAKMLSALSSSLPVLQNERESARIERTQSALDSKDAGTVDFTFSDQTPAYVLIIDEINRGNISKILGELITLLEPDRRLGSNLELKLPLAYSPQHRFAVPPNLHIIGTMNTADRSIALMDAALRRRFRFEEMLPQQHVLRSVLREHVAKTEFIDLVVELFETMNARIRHMFDQDHQIGHAYFLKVRNLRDLRRTFSDRIIPLLQEYFYGAWDRVCLVLGCPYDEDGSPLRRGPCYDKSKKEYKAPLIHANTRIDSEAIFGFSSNDIDTSLDYSVSPRFGQGPRAGNVTEIEILIHFLSVLNLDQETWKEKEQNFAPEAEA